jgi:hypothetical protein
MGLFDDVRCAVPLPDGFTGRDFQTKDFEDPYMDKYVITSEGRLVRRDGDKTTDLNFHGYLNFYDWSKEDGRHGYNAKFTDGQLVSITPEMDPRQ